MASVTPVVAAVVPVIAVAIPPVVAPVVTPVVAPVVAPVEPVVPFVPAAGLVVPTMMDPGPMAGPDVYVTHMVPVEGLANRGSDDERQSVVVTMGRGGQRRGEACGQDTSSEQGFGFSVHAYLLVSGTLTVWPNQ
jgi:hypothetical protein